ncbi:glutamate-5-semialdehyde dehydrogenase [Shouchella clausii]
MATAKLISQKAKAHAPSLSQATTAEKNNLLQAMAQQLKTDADVLLEANQLDIANAKKNGLSDHLIDRLLLTKARIDAMATAIDHLIELPDPIGAVKEQIKRPNGLVIKEMVVPFGVVGMIYEARPNVTVDACTLAVKTGNAVVLRGSASALHSNKAIVRTLKKAFKNSPIHPDVIQLLEDTSKEEAANMMQLKSTIDVLIPRGGANLIQTVLQEATIPVIETGVGNCHVYVASSADPDMAFNIVVNAKTQRPSVCNACETLLVEQSFAKAHLPTLVERLSAKGVSLVGNEGACTLDPRIAKANEDDWSTEYLDLRLAIRVVADTNEAIAHINQYGTKHSEAIITESLAERDTFFATVDAACVYHNASTRFTDGFEFGFGAEIGISTQKLHARGPMGLKALTTSKYGIYGEGQVKE